MPSKRNWAGALSAHLLLAAAVLAPAPALAQGPLIVPEVEAAGSILATAGRWLLSVVASKVLTDQVDQARGRDVETQVKQAEARLKKQLDQGTVDRQQLADALNVAKTELAMLKNVLSAVPNAQKLDRDRRKLEADLATIRPILEDHERRLAVHEQQLEKQDSDIRRQGQELEALKQRINEGPEHPVQYPSAPPPDAPASAAGTLIIKVRGRGNMVRLYGASRHAKTGVFLISRDGAVASYFVPAGVRAIVELMAPGNFISVPAALMPAVKIESHGWYYQSLVY
jgi:hypothetical protein